MSLQEQQRLKTPLEKCLTKKPTQKEIEIIHIVGKKFGVHDKDHKKILKDPNATFITSGVEPAKHITFTVISGASVLATAEVDKVLAEEKPLLKDCKDCSIKI